MVMSRLEFWKRFGLLFAAVMGFGFLTGLFIRLVEHSESIVAMGISIVLLKLIPVVVVVAFIITLRWFVFRLHDVGLRGWWYFLGFVPYIGELILFVILLLPSNTFDLYHPVDDYVEE